MKILLVDDSLPAREPLEMQLRSLKHDLTTADDGLDAYAHFLQNSYDLVLTDIRMPNLDGLELLRLIKENKPDQDVVMVTGYGDMDSSLEALRLGACNYLLKPVSLDELTLAVRTIEQRQDMTRRLLEQEAKLNQARKMADLGLVAAGVAHEINNPNTFIRGNAQILEKFWALLNPYIRSAIKAGVPAPDKIDFILEEIPNTLDGILNGSERIRQIVEQTAAFTQPSDEDAWDPIDLNECISIVADKMRGELGDIRLNIELEQALPLVSGTWEGIKDIVTELVTNGSRALVGISDPKIDLKTIYGNSGKVTLSVTDNGIGIPLENQQKVFTPFFTSTPRIGRPGLGLSKIYALVRGYGGETYFTSKKGEGTRFHVKLNVYEQRTKP